MSNSQFRFSYNDVLEADTGNWWHVANRFECIDTGRRMYRLWDATHTADRIESAEYVEGSGTFEYAGWNTDTKPAHEHGYRVNGILTEPENVDRWMGQECKSDYDCPNCGEGTQEKADLVVSLTNRQKTSAKIICGACGMTREVSDD